MEYKHHVLHPDANTVSFEHHYEQSDGKYYNVDTICPRVFNQELVLDLMHF